MAELQAEKDAIAEERKKAEDMMAELMALKAQLENQQKTPEEKPATEEKVETEEKADTEEKNETEDKDNTEADETQEKEV